MSRLSVLALVVALGCGGKSTPPTSPLPEDKPAEPVAKPAVAPEPPKEPEAKPIEVAIESQPVTVTLKNAGKGKKTALAYTGKQGDKATIELSFDFLEKHFASQELGGDGENGMPTIVFNAEADTTAADATNIAYTYTVKSSDVREVAGAKVSAAELKEALATLEGLSIEAKVGPNGVASDKTLVKVAKGNQIAEQIVNLVQFSLPAWPVLPKEPVGVGAKWQTTTTANVVGQVTVTVTTDYELVARKGTTNTIKGTTKVTGTEQTKGQSKITDINGSGTTQATLVDGQLFPAFRSSVETNFAVSDQGKAIKLSLRVGGEVKPTGPNAPVAPAPAPVKADPKAKAPAAKAPAAAPAAAPAKP